MTARIPLLERDIERACCDLGIWIRLTKGYATLIDRDDAALAELRWSACYRRSKNGTVRVYAVRQWTENGVKHRIFLHQSVVGPSDYDIDHKDGDSLNNRRANLRSATRGQNNANATKRIGTSSRWKGVHLHQQSGNWSAQIKKRHLGQFVHEYDAAQAYNFAAEIEYGEFARFNLP